MTREQARIYLKCSGMSKEQRDTVENAFSNLDDIRKEINDLIEDVHGVGDNPDYMDGLIDALGIINKHSEENDGMTKREAIAIMEEIKADVIQMNHYDYVRPVTCEEVIAIINKHIREVNE